MTQYFDYYGALFDEHQKAIFEDYVCNDMSLAEIAEREGMTRQGVSDLVKRISNKLYEYEEGLQLVKKASMAKDVLDEMESIVSRKDSSQTDSAEIRELCTQLRSIL